MQAQGQLGKRCRRWHLSPDKEEAAVKSQTAMTIAELKPYQDKTVVLNLHDGECATAKVTYVDEEYEDIIVDIFHTSRPEAYKVSINSCAFTIPAAAVDSIQEISN